MFRFFGQKAMNAEPFCHPLLEVSDLAAAYGSKFALQGLSFELRSGECLALLGANGSGKTSLLRCIAGTLPPKCGRILLDGKDLSDITTLRRARMLAVLAQQTERPAKLKVRDFVLLGRYPWLSWFGFYREEDHHCAIQALYAADGDCLADREVRTLSGGEWQRVLLARALAQMQGCAKPLFLLDEPSGALDLARGMELFALLQRRMAYGAALLLAIHDCNLAAMYASGLGMQKDLGRAYFWLSVAQAKDASLGSRLQAAEQTLNPAERVKVQREARNWKPSKE